MIYVTKRDGIKEPFKTEKDKKTISWAVNGFDLDPLMLERKFSVYLKDGISTSELIHVKTKAALSLIDQNDKWFYVAGRLQMMDLNKKVRYKLNEITGRNDQFKYGYHNTYEKFQWMIDQKYYRNLNTYFSEKEFKQCINMIDQEQDLRYSYSTVISMEGQYLIRDSKNGVIELPQEMYLATAMTLSIPYHNIYDKLEIVQKFYQAMSKLEISMATPTIANIRKPNSSGTSCEIVRYADSLNVINHVNKVITEDSSKGTGFGLYIGDVRARGSWIQNVAGVAGGTIPYVKIVNDIIVATDQLGVRKGNITVTQDIFHLDFPDFLELKDENGDQRDKAHDIFRSVSIPDLFFEREEAKAQWTMFDPYEVEKVTGKKLNEYFGDDFKKFYEELEKMADNGQITLFRRVNARTLYLSIMKRIYEAGDPMFFYRDTVNKTHANSHVGLVYSSNLCVTGDTRLHTSMGMITAKELYDMGQDLEVVIDNRTNFNWKEFGITLTKAIPMHKTAEDADIWKITTKDGREIKSTEWHEYYVRNNDKQIVKKKLKELSEGDILMTQSGEGEWGNFGDYNLGVLVGYVTGDGTFTSRDRNKCAVCVDIYGDEIGYYKPILETVILGVKEKYISYGNNNHQKYKMSWSKERVISSVNKDCKVVKTRASSKAIGKYLWDNGFKPETKLTVPDFIFKGKRETVIGYLQGLFSADGTVGTSNDITIQITSKSKILLQGVQQLLSNFGVDSNITPTKVKIDNKITFVGKTFYRLSILKHDAKIYMEKIGFFPYSPKQNKAENTIKNIEFFGDNPNRIFSKFCSPIKSIEYIGKEDVYDTTQEYNHSLIFNGIVTGNCHEITSVQKQDEESEQYYDAEKNQYYESRKVGLSPTCNLASINFAKLTDTNIERIATLVTLMVNAVTMLTEVANPSAKRFNSEFNSIGIGYLGVAHWCALNKLPYGSQEMLEKTDKILEEIARYIVDTSAELAKYFGKYQHFDGSDWAKGIYFGKDISQLSEKWQSTHEKVQKYGMRNGYLMAIAPNTSTSVLMSETPSIYPFKSEYVQKDGIAGKFMMPSPDLDELRWYYKFLGRVTHDEYINTVACFQRWVDMAISMEMPLDINQHSPKDVYMFYKKTFKRGLKTTYYSRTKSLGCTACEN